MKKLWENGKILSLNKELEYDWILVEDDKIVDLGYKGEEPDTVKTENIYDLKSKVLMPSFIDSHSHFSANVYSFIQVDLSKCENFHDIKEEIKKYIQVNKIEKDKWITAIGYDHNNLEEKDHPRKDILDSISSTNPIAIHHQSGHVGTFNSLALDYLGIDENTITPDGGLIERNENGLTGYMEENAFIENVKKAPMPDMNSIQESIKKAEKRYLSYGITTVQEGMMVKELIPLYNTIMDEMDLDVDIIYYTGLEDKEIVLNKFPETFKDYKNNVRFGGIKLFLDGSPQGKTAWLREAYAGDDDNFGYGTMTDEELYQGLKVAYDENLQPLAHCNGDAATQQYINAIEKLKKEGKNLRKLRPIMIHAQLLGRDQMEKTSELGIIPSFFLAHIYYWGDIHIKNLGIERASYISPVKTALDYKIPFTLHQDSPVILPNMIETISCAVNRKTKSGVSLGESERISAKDAVKAITINAAYEYFEEDIKGTLEKGKKANFVILSKDPMSVAKDEINSIEILQTIKDGEKVYEIK